MKLHFTQEQLKELLDAQDGLNIKYTGEEWRNDVPISSFITALDTEVSEYLESSPRVGDKICKMDNGWKWWKQNLQNDEQNQAIETIDVLHFGLSLLMMLSTKEEILKISNETNEMFEKEVENIPDYLDSLTFMPISAIQMGKATIVMCCYDHQTQGLYESLMHVIATMAINCNRTLDDIYDGYFKKNELNAKRVENGYIQGEYQKLDENGQEDNRKLEV